VHVVKGSRCELVPKTISQIAIAAAFERNRTSSVVDTDQEDRKMNFLGRNEWSNRCWGVVPTAELVVFRGCVRDCGKTL
jgi:hypothetical protein